MNNPDNIIGNQIAYMLKERNMSQHTLAARAGITDTSMSRYISGDRIPDGPVVLRIAKALHSTSDFLLGYSAEEEDPEYVYYSILERSCCSIAKSTPFRENSYSRIW